MTTHNQLHYQLHISEPIPVARPETAPNGERQTFQYIATTLISGARDAVLIDPPMTTEQSAQVINWVEASGKTIKHIFITHGHGDHWFGTGPLLKRFPEVTVLAAPGTIEVVHYHASPGVRAAVWDKNFPGQIPEASVVATTPPDNTFELEGNELRIVEVGHTDTDKTTVLHGPSIGLVVAGDAVYNGVHQHLVESGNSERLSRICHSALEFYNAMLELYPNRLNPTALSFWGALALFPAAANA